MPRSLSTSLRAHAWQVSLGRLLLLLLIALVFGLVVGQVLICFLVALAAYGLWMLWSLAQLQRWLGSRTREAPPFEQGVWSEIASFIQSRHQSMRQRQRRLVRLLRAYRSAATALPDGIIVLSPLQQVVWANPAAEGLLGFRLSKARGQPVLNLLTEPVMREWLLGQPQQEPLIDVQTAADRDKRLSMRLVPYQDDHAMLIVRDISLLMKLEQVRRDFVANVSHELRTPLTVIHGYLDMIETDEHPSIATMIEEMHRQSKRMAQVVEDLLTLSRLDATEAAGDEPVSMTAMMATLKREAEALSKGQHQIQVDNLCQADLHGSMKDLHSAFSNLIANAVRYTPTGGSITVRWQLKDQGACFSVQDTGFGIPAEHIPRLTERFYRVSTSRSREKGGTGLGLSIVKHVLNLHQAKLNIESQVGVGSMFSCCFPAERLRPRD
ncbi:phosphate regulon sensor histidine kinase PhoR [Ahniella affigens]|uniref:Phosphate regulon sensor protein PhoR n=1 Tax=Ahniella affigens TaxID=2021234 RepID=A0A2P1PSH3_9GAMM|nr:phosphate regulon sensor histidine kinase PhoR [Ahniella affigens]AVP97788.1 phosphate regulon sensor histidine kinase PhoR [Ahniella affigens]